jgi:flagellar biogenesis protein FliO
MEKAKMKITPLQMPPRAGAFALTPTFAAARLKFFWKAWVGRARGKRKTLAVRETAALGDRRLVSVIQFERQRFLIGSSPSSVTLLAQLPDESASGEGSGKETESGERN